MANILRCAALIGAGAAALAAASGTSMAVDIYSWQDTDFFPTSLVRWANPPSGGTTRIGSIDDDSFDIAFSPNGVLWGTDGSSVFTIDTTTGQPSALTPITSHIFGLNEFLVGVTFSPSGQMYSWSINSTTSGIYRINPGAGTATAVTSKTEQPIFGMTFGPTGILYASTINSLVTLDPNTGAILSTIGDFTVPVTSLGYGPDGFLRGLSSDASGTGTDLVLISTRSAATEMIGYSPETLYGVAAIPAPGTLGAIAVAGIVAIRRRRSLLDPAPNQGVDARKAAAAPSADILPSATE